MPLRTLVCAILVMVLASSAHGSPSITLVGDEYLGVVMRGLAGREGSEIRTLDGVYELTVESAGVTLRSLVPGGGATAMADLLHASDITLIVVDATRGPTPVIREHVLIARQARVPMLAILFTNVNSLFTRAPDEAAELLALEIAELRELLSAYDLDGDAARVFLDHRPAQETAGVVAYGSHETVLALARFAPRRVRNVEMGRVKSIWGAVYLLTDLEVDGNATDLGPKDSVVLWSEGTQSKATLESVSSYHPGDFREMPLSMEAPVLGVEGSRILLVNDDRVVGLGAITQIVE